jgi:hypothetical protein
MPKFRKQAEIRLQPMEDPQRLNVVFDRVQLARLKAEALAHDTTASEIVRVLVGDWLKKVDSTR